jgi:hypothetical protein
MSTIISAENVVQISGALFIISLAQSQTRQSTPFGYVASVMQKQMPTTELQVLKEMQQGENC